MTLPEVLEALHDRVSRLEQGLLLLQRTPLNASVATRMRNHMKKGMSYKVRYLARALEVPLNTIHVTLRRNPQYFLRVGWGRYTKVK